MLLSVASATSVNERICAIDVDIRGRRFRFIAVYMPHGGCDDEEVEGTYAQLDQLLSRAGRTNRTNILVGDWKAVIGQRQTGDDEVVVGAHGIGIRNSRGELLAAWASKHRLLIANTVMENSFEDTWTYESGGTKRQLDYCLIQTN